MMEKLVHRYSVISLFLVGFVLIIGGPPSVSAATAPPLGSTISFGIISSTFTNTNTSPQTIINGDVCYTTPPTTAPLSITGTTTTPCDPATGTDQAAALANLNGQTCTSLGVGTVNLESVVIGANPAGTFPPGCYSSGGDMTITLSTTVTLNGAGVYIFRPGGALTTGANSSIVLTGGAKAADVFWAPIGATTLGANAAPTTTPTFVGTIIDAAGITLGHFAHLSGRALAFGGTVTTDANTITVPTTLHVIKAVVNNSGGSTLASGFTVHVKLAGTDVSGSPAAGTTSPGTTYALAPGTYVVSEDANTSYALALSGDCNAGGSVTLTFGADKTCTLTNDDAPGTINVVNIVINDSGRTKTVADFPLFVSGTPVTSGATNTFAAPATYTVSETTDADYTPTFSGDCNTSGSITLAPADSAFCVVTNDDIGATVAPVPGLIEIIKVPSPLTLPNGAGPVTYTYTLRNIGTEPVSNIALVGDTCNPIVLVSGDTNNNAILETSETWIHTCSSTLTATHTNTVVATGVANGLTAIDVASATVVVGSSAVPPLIHVTKVPSPLTLLTSGGVVIYTYTVTNPGTEPLHNVSVTDDKCTGLPGRVSGHPGDLNKNDLLESNETWTFTCRSTLTKTTTNTASATGEANGLTARDLAIATVVVASLSPGFPDTGFAPEEKSLLWLSFLLSGSLIVTFLLDRKKICPQKSP